MVARPCHAEHVLETLMGIGLASSAGLNAYIPLLIIGLLGRYTHLVTLPSSWHWMESGWVVSGLIVLLAVEMVVDKIPVIDHVNDAVQTLVRPTAGGLAFGAASTAQTPAVSHPVDLFAGHPWIPIVAGMAISFVIHAMKAAARPVVNATTAGFGAPVASTAEDIVSVAMSFIAILAPLLIILALGGLVAVFVALRRRRRRRREEKAAQRAIAGQPR
jgi:uncharacterized protein DUF4126